MNDGALAAKVCSKNCVTHFVTLRNCSNLQWGHNSHCFKKKLMTIMRLLTNEFSNHKLVAAIETKKEVFAKGDFHVNISVIVSSITKRFP